MFVTSLALKVSIQIVIMLFEHIELICRYGFANLAMQRSDNLANSLGGQKTPVVCALTKTLSEMDFGAVSDLFAQNESGSPSVLWNPSVFDISDPIIKSFAEFMEAPGIDAYLLSEGIPFQGETHAFEPWIMVLEPTSDHLDFRYLKYGFEIAAMFGRDLTGDHTSDIGGYISEFFIALYSAVMLRKQCVLSVHVPPPGVFATAWRRLICPLMDDLDRVRMIAAVNVPDNDLRAGLEALPDPAFVTQMDGTMMYANASAQKLFGEPSLPRRQLSEFCEISIELPSDIEGFARAKSSTISQTIGSRNQVLVHFELRVSATFFRGTPYFIVQLKPN